MFTGIVTAVGEVASVEAVRDIRRIAIATAEPVDAALGASISCSGVCLTVTGHLPANRGFTVDVGPETLRVTTAGDWRAGTRINLERSLRMGDELGGHLVSGHVDGVATITDRVDHGETVAFTFAAPPDLARFVAVKGSVALDGTSLTVNTVEGAGFSCHLIPHTLAVTNWGDRRIGDRVNLEVDVMARYAARLAERV
ncbi:MAG: riboflavin synthase [Bauldia sp.]|nr:riboflavin synthase [Bauldia sp.]